MSVVRVNYSTRPEFFKLLPLACVLQSEEVDEEIATISTNFLVALCETVTLPKYIPDLIDAIRQVSLCPFWSAREAIAEFISAFVFHNMATLNSRPEWVVQVNFIHIIKKNTNSSTNVYYFFYSCNLLFFNYWKIVNRKLEQRQLKYSVVCFIASSFQILMNY